MDIDSMFDAFDCYDSGDLVDVRARYVEGLKRLELNTREPEAFDESTVEDWRLRREVVKELLCREADPVTGRVR